MVEDLARLVMLEMVTLDEIKDPKIREQVRLKIIEGWPGMPIVPKN